MWHQANVGFTRELRADAAGSGSLGDIGSHIVDLGRYLVGEFREVCALSETFVKRRPLPGHPRRRGQVTVDDAVSAMGRFRNGALASLEATRFAPGRKNGLTIEINGSAGSLVFGGGHVVLPLLQSMIRDGLISAQNFFAGYGAVQA